MTLTSRIFGIDAFITVAPRRRACIILGLPVDPSEKKDFIYLLRLLLFYI